MKPNYIYFYKSDNAVDDILKHSPFCYQKPTKIKRSRDEARIEYEHFDLRCFRMNYPNQQSVRGHKTWQVLVEDILYDELEQDFINECLFSIMNVYYLVGGRVVKVDKYED